MTETAERVFEVAEGYALRGREQWAAVCRCLDSTIADSEHTVRLWLADHIGNRRSGHEGWVYRSRWERV